MWAEERQIEAKSNKVLWREIEMEEIKYMQNEGIDGDKLEEKLWKIEVMG